jgi:hypothetical protein
VLLKIVRQGEDAHGQVIDPDEIPERFIPIIELGCMNKQTIKVFLGHFFSSGLHDFSPHTA